MGNEKDTVERFINGFISDKTDLWLSDILWTFYYCLPSETGYHQHPQEFAKWFGLVCTRNLQKKSRLPQTQLREAIRGFVNTLNEVTELLPKETYYDAKQLLEESLLNRTAKKLIDDAKQRFLTSSELQRNVLSFTLKYIPQRIEESRQKADEARKRGEEYRDEYYFLHDFSITVKDQTGEITDFMIIDARKWSHVFNMMFDRELREFKQKLKIPSGQFPRNFPLLFYAKGYEEYCYYEFGDLLAELGIGYWISRINAKGDKADVSFVIPKFIYDSVVSANKQLPRIPEIPNIDSETRFDFTELKWNIKDFIIDSEPVSEISEADIEEAILNEPGVLEDGLQVIENQCSTSVGYIDILCKDTKGDFVVVELKKGTGSFEVVGQIQKYLTWVDENWAEGKRVRGFIVVREKDKDLEYSAKGSKYRIDVKIFGAEAPLPENIRYCENCGKPNKKSAKHCRACGTEFWL